LYVDKPRDFQFTDFVDYFNRAGEEEENRYYFDNLNEVGQETGYALNHGVYYGLQRNLIQAQTYFDQPNSINIDENEILKKGQMSVIDVLSQTEFGSVLLRDLLYKIEKAKDEKTEGYNIPILIIIDEVNSFYSSNSSKEALGVLSKICREGRSKKMGIIFASQNPTDIPRGLSSVINTHIFFKTDSNDVKKLGFKPAETSMLRKGYAVAQIHELSQVRIVKFPLSYSGVLNE